MSIFTPSLIVDIIFLAAMIIPVFTYASKGFLRSVIEFFSFWIALFATYLTAPIVLSFAQTEGLLKVIVYVVVMILWLVVIKLIAKLFSSVLSKLPLIGKLDKLLGAVLGLLMGVIFASMLVYIAGIVVKDGTELYDIINNSKIVEFLDKINIFKLFSNLIK